METLLDVLRHPVVVTILAVGFGICVGLAQELRSARAYWGSALAVGITSAGVAALSPPAFLAPSGAILGFALTVIIRNRLQRDTGHEGDHR